MSADSVKAQNSFCEKQGFQYPVLSDPEKRIIKTYEAWGKKKFMGKEYEGIFRYSYLIDEKGKFEKAYEKVKVIEHAKEVLSDIS